MGNSKQHVWWAAAAGPIDAASQPAQPALPCCQPSPSAPCSKCDHGDPHKLRLATAHPLAVVVVHSHPGLQAGCPLQCRAAGLYAVEAGTPDRVVCAHVRTNELYYGRSKVSADTKPPARCSHAGHAHVASFRQSMAAACTSPPLPTCAWHASLGAACLRQGRAPSSASHAPAACRNLGGEPLRL